MKLDARTIERVEEASREIAILFIAIAFLCFGALGWALWSLRGRDSTRDH